MKSNLIAENGVIGPEKVALLNQPPPFEDWVYSAIKPYLKDRILEIGSRQGRWTEILLNNNNQLKISDTSGRFCNLLEEKYRFNRLIRGIEKINPSDNRFEENHGRYLENCDTVIFLNPIELPPDSQLIMTNLKKLISRTGNLIVWLPIRTAIYTDSLNESLEYWKFNNIQKINQLFGKAFWVRDVQFFNIQKDNVNENQIPIPSFAEITDPSSTPTGLSAIAIGMKL